MEQAFKKLQLRLTKQPWIVEEKTAKERTLIYIAGVVGSTFNEEYLLHVIGLLRNPKTRIMFVTSKQIEPVILEYYFQLFSRNQTERVSMEQRWDHFFVGNTEDTKTLTQKILQSQRVRKQIVSKLHNTSTSLLCTYIETPTEHALAVKLGIPLYVSDNTEHTHAFQFAQMATVQLKHPVHYYVQTIRSDKYIGLSPKKTISIVRNSGLGFDPKSNLGIILYGLSTVRKRGVIGVVSVAQSSEAAEQLCILLKRALDIRTKSHVAKMITKEPIVDRKRLVNTFLELARISSPSGHESALRVILREELVRLGVSVRVDQAGNIIGKKAGKGKVPILLSAHMDTVQPCERVKPVVRGNMIMSDGRTILGADNKAGIVYILEVLRMISIYNVEHKPLEIVFSTKEEQFSQGIQNLDMSKIKAPFGLVVDGAGLGEVDFTAPYIATLDVIISGKSAHSGVEPEKGVSAIQIAAQAINAIKLGRLHKDTTANIGVMSGGTNRNAIPDNVELVGEVRSLSRKKLEEQLERMHKALEDAAEHFGGLLSIDSKVAVPGYQFPKNDPHIQQIMSVMKQVGIKPYLRQAGGGSDANIFVARGVKAIDVGTGVEKPHTVEERIAIPDMVKMTEFLFVMIKYS